MPKVATVVSLLRNDVFDMRVIMSRLAKNLPEG